MNRRIRGIQNLNMLVFAVCMCTVIITVGQDYTQEYVLKAGYMERFTRFIDIPDSILAPNPDSAFIIGVLGDDPFKGALESFYQDNTIKKHRVEIRHFNNIEQAKNCHMLFVSHSIEKQLPQIVKATRGFPLITIGETKSYARRGVMINFYIEQNKIRFEINLDTVEQSGLKISHLLLNAARPIK